MKVRGSPGGCPQASLAAEGRSAARRQPITRLASPPVRLLFIACVVLIAVGVAFRRVLAADSSAGSSAERCAGNVYSALLVESEESSR